MSSTWRGVRFHSVTLLVTLLWALATLVAAPRATTAHTIPDNVILEALVHPDAHDLSVFLHVPVAMLRASHATVDGEAAPDDPRTPEERLAEASAEIVNGLQFFEDERPLSLDGEPLARFSGLNRPFQTFADALRVLHEPPSVRDRNTAWTSGWVDIYLKYRIESASSPFSMDVTLGEDLGGLLRFFVRYISASGSVRAYEFHGSSGMVTLDPGWAQAAWTFGKLGFEHILGGVDHLLFLLCLVIPFGLRHIRSLIGVVTAFTIAHSITLIASASGLVPTGQWFPPLVETMIAVSIVYMALENLILALGKYGSETSLVRRCFVVGAFGLVHGFGFSFLLREQLQFAGTHLLVSLVSFNVGVEIGQLTFLALILPILTVLLGRPDHRRIGIAIVSILVAHVAWHWLAERWSGFVDAARPLFGYDDLASAGTVALLVLLVGGGIAAAVIQARRSLGRRSGAGGVGAGTVDGRASLD